MDKKNNTIIIIISIIVLIIIVVILTKNQNQNKKIRTEPISQTEIDLNQAIESDTTLEINKSLDNIDLTDTSDEDLKSVDEELGNL